MSKIKELLETMSEEEAAAEIQQRECEEAVFEMLYTKKFSASNIIQSLILFASDEIDRIDAGAGYDDQYIKIYESLAGTIGLIEELNC